MNEPRRLQVLCVDDEPNVLEGLSLHLRRRYAVATAPNGASGLDHLAHKGPTAVVISDLRMPGMDGVSFLAQAREVAPDAVRILLTGQAELNPAVSAINQGQIFRFLVKPCVPPDLMAAVDAAAAQHRLIAAERELLEQTLHGSIKALTDVLALTNPAAFGRASRIRQEVTALVAKLEAREHWPVEVAAMVSQLGFITLPPDLVEKIYLGDPLSEDEQAMAGRAPAVAERLLANIPRLESVREILATYLTPFRSSPPSVGGPGEHVTLAAHILRVAVDFEVLEGRGASANLAVDTMLGRGDEYSPDVMAALAAIHRRRTSREVRELPLGAIGVGMVLAEDLRLQSGVLLATRGSEITASLLERARNFRPRTVREPVRVILRTPTEHP
jgi:response regulator RpfG family c-di-GMP phosphodiesterase